MTIKGVLKLVSQPKQFLKDYAKKSKNSKGYLQGFIRNKQKKYFPKKVFGEDKYTVVSAVYGVESYLDDYFKSLVNQTLDFKQHIYLVMVDDGSLDDSAQIIKKWQEKYPNNITYVKKENGGQASARNLGLEYVETEWVTFIDPDDFVNRNYFENIDTILQEDKSNNIGMVACRWKIYHEDKKTYSFSHPLDFRHKEGNKVIKYRDDKNFLPSSVATSLYRYKVIKKFNIKFDEKLKPNFEDGHFSAKYFVYMEYDSIAYASDSHYIYRKRASGDSTMDSSWNNKDRFNLVMKRGYLDILKNYNDKGDKDYAVQRLVMYDIFWYFKKIINNPASISFLSFEEKKAFKELVYKMFESIDTEVILRYNLAGYWFFHKVGFLGMLKNEKPPFQIIYIDDYDKEKKLLKLRYFYYGDLPLEEYKIDGKYTIPAYSKTRKHFFLDDLFAKERIVWLDISSAKKNYFT